MSERIRMRSSKRMGSTKRSRAVVREGPGSTVMRAMGPGRVQTGIGSELRGVRVVLLRIEAIHRRETTAETTRPDVGAILAVPETGAVQENL